MTRKQIEMMREIRLWIGQIIVPSALAVGTALTIPEVRDLVADKARNMKNSVKIKLHKEERP